MKISTASTYQYHDADPAVVRRNIEGTKQFLQLTADVGAQGVRVFPNGVPDEGNPNREKTLEQIVGHGGDEHEGDKERFAAHQRLTGFP